MTTLEKSVSKSTSAIRGRKLGSSTRRTGETALELPLVKYQQHGVRWLLEHPFSGLLLDPGLGKTLILLTAFYILKRAGFVDWLLVVAPVTPCYQVWPEEIKKWKFPFTYQIIHGVDKETAIKSKADVYITNYDSLQFVRERIELLTKRGRGWLTLDESTKVKHRKSIRHQLMESILQCFGRRTILTGTPIPNGYDDLWGQVYCLDRGERLGLFQSHYRYKWFVKSGFMGWSFTPKDKKSVKEIEHKIRDVCLRYSDKELGLKKWKTVTRYVKLPPAARVQYERLKDSMVLELKEGTVTCNNPGVLTSKLRQVASGGVYVTDELRGTRTSMNIHNAKTDALVDLVDELSGNPLLTMYEFDHDRDRCLEAIPTAEFIDGGTSMKKRIATMKRFNAGEIQVLLAQEATISLGVNLQNSCHHVALYTIPWDLEHWLQFIKRVHRKGQSKQVFVHYLVAQDTVDERVMEVLAGKDRTQRALLDSLRRYHLKLS